MSKYKKKPVEVEAELVSDIIDKFIHNYKELPEWIKKAYEDTVINTITENGFIIKTLEGNMTATREDYLIKGIEDELYPCKKEIFEKTYIKVEE